MNSSKDMPDSPIISMVPAMNYRLFGAVVRHLPPAASEIVTRSYVHKIVNEVLDELMRPTANMVEAGMRGKPATYENGMTSREFVETAEIFQAMILAARDGQ